MLLGAQPCAKHASYSMSEATFTMQDVLHQQLERATSQAEQECQAILGAAGASRPPSAAEAPDAAPPSQAAHKHQRTAGPEQEAELIAQQV